MKIQCDVCAAEAATVLCCADEAALCRLCDDSVHSANKLAGKHRRVSLLQPSSKTFPLCDICKERRGFVFCKDDRAILCKDCDFPIHSANTNARKHIRFLISGIRLSTIPIPSSSSSFSPSPPPYSDTEMASSSVTANSRVSEEDNVHSAATATPNDNSGGSTISDYLMNLLPGWRVDDFLSDDADTAGNLTGCHFISEPAPAKMEDLAVWWPPFPAARVTHIAQERRSPLLDSMERGRSGRGEEASMISQLQLRQKSKKRSMASLWY